MKKLLSGILSTVIMLSSSASIPSDTANAADSGTIIDTLMNNYSVWSMIALDT